MKAKFNQLEKILNTLETIAKKQKEDSIEYQSIELSAKALTYIYTQGNINEFTKYVEDFHNILTPEQKDFLAKNEIGE